ncbi:MAG: carbamate kinase [Acidobacteria bacterium]|nr:carbamate kinase [Acidobacteriota bacterium]
MNDSVVRHPLALIAFGGNALVPRGGEGTQEEQEAEAASFAHVITDLARDHRVLLVHGNGPQVGQLLIQVEAGRRQVPPWSLAACGAATQGIIGFVLEAALRARLEADGLPPRVAVVVTLAEVDPQDPAFDSPTKPIGPYYPLFVARDLMDSRGWQMVRQDQGWRRVVPSPNPVRVHGVDTIRELLDDGFIVIAGGGGGIPVVRQDGALVGVDAVIDKDRTAALLSRDVEADLFTILTNVDRVERDYDTDRAAPIDRMTPAEARALLNEGQFPPGSMGPKIEAALEVVEMTGRKALITSVRALADALRGRGGTWLVP